MAAGIGVASYFAFEASQRAQDAEIEGLRARQAKEEAQDHLCRALFEQARAIRAAPPPGRRWKALELLKEANRLRTRDRAGGEPAEVLPSPVELRSEALAALLQPDARLALQLPIPHGTLPAVTADGRRAAVHWSKPAANKNGVRLIDLADGKEMSRLEDNALGSSTGHFALSPDGSRLAVGGILAEGVQLWDTATGERLPLLPWPKEAPPFANAYTMPRFVPGTHLLAGNRSTSERTCVVLWDLDRPGPGRLVVDFANSLPESANLPCVAFSPDGRRVAYREKEKTLTVVELARPESPQRFELPLKTGPVLVWSADSELVAVPVVNGPVAAASLLLWDIVRGQERTRAEGNFQMDGAFPVAIHPDSTLVAAACVDGSIRIFRTKDGKEWLRLAGSYADNDGLLHWSADGRLIWAGQAGLRVWEVLRDDGIATPIGPVPLLDAFAFSHDGRYLAVFAPEAEPPRLILLDRSPPGRTTACEIPGLYVGAVLDFHRDGKRLTVLGPASELNASQCVTWDVTTGRELFRCDSGRARTQAAWSSLALRPDGHVWTTALKGTTGVAVWDVTDRREIRAFAQDAFHHKMLGDNPAMRLLSPDGRWLLLQPPPDQATALPLFLWEVETGRLVLERKPPAGAAPVTGPGAWFSADGRRLLLWRWPVRTDAEAPAAERSVRVLELPSGAVRLELPDNSLTGACDFSPDGRQLFLGHDDGTTRLWDVDRAEELLRWRPAPGWIPDALGVTGRGELVATANRWDEIYLLDLARLRRALAGLGLDW
jgi:WD40 repeat protein